MKEEVMEQVLTENENKDEINHLDPSKKRILESSNDESHKKIKIEHDEEQLDVDNIKKEILTNIDNKEKCTLDLNNDKSHEISKIEQKNDVILSDDKNIKKELTNNDDDDDEKNLKDEENPYAYLDRDDFTSEKYKIEVRGLPKYYGVKDLKKLINEKLGLISGKVKPAKRGSAWAYVCFRSQETQDQAIEAINGYTWKNRKLTAKKAKPAPDPFIKRKLELIDDESNKKIENDKVAISPEDQIKSSTIPLWNLSYAEQLEQKQKEIKKVLYNMGEKIFKSNELLRELLSEKKKKNDGLICELMPILSADVTDGYRNKCEFTIGKSKDGTEILIGFRMAAYVTGSVAVGPIDHLCHIPESMKKAVKVCQEFVRNSSLAPFNPVNHSGYWAQVTVRTTRNNHLMLVIAINPQDMTIEELNKLKKEICEFFDSDAGKKANVTSLYFQTINKKDIGGEGGGTIEHLSGSEYIEETLLGMTFRVSPQAFFQVNTEGAELLYKAAIDMAKPDDNTTVLDVCCGTGTIGLSFSKYCGEILGLEMIGDAIKDARENVKKNNIENCEFFVGKAENILKAVINRASKPNIVAVVDPPRAGLHQQALLALRKTSKLNKVVYISCDPKAAVQNLIDLAKPSSKLYTGEPLIPVKAIPVDMFPHTKHCELVILLERVSKTKDTSVTTVTE